MRTAYRGFTFEGIRRRAVIDPNDGVRKDVTCLAILDTDWAMRAYRKPVALTSWDEMFSRHSAEREMMLGWHRERRQRTSSLRTVRQDQHVSGQDEKPGDSSASVRFPSVSPDSGSESWSDCASPPPFSSSEAYDSAPESSSYFPSDSEEDSPLNFDQRWSGRSSFNSVLSRRLHRTIAAETADESNSDSSWVALEGTLSDSEIDSI